ncbi:MAG: hypothetical protein FWJ74_00175 [Gemmatimonadota bacterium]
MAQESRAESVTGRPDAERVRTAEPATTDEARRAIEETRGRISATLDEIEGRIEEARENIREKVDVTRPIRNRLREHPLPGIGIVFGAGLVLGLLTGGKEKEGKHREMPGKEEREELRRWRAERRERLREHGRRRERGARGPSFIRQTAGLVASAALAGLMTRVRRRITGEGRPESRELRAAA